MNISNVRAFLVFLLVVCGTVCGFGQNNTGQVAHRVLKNGKTLIPIKAGEVVIYKDQKYQLPDEIRLIPLGAKVTVNGVEGTLEASSEGTGLAAYPAAFFAVSGALVNSNNGITGGTKIVTGYIASVDHTFASSGPQSYSIGGFYFRSYDGTADLYQIGIQSFPHETYGFQLAYLNSTLRNANAVSGHLLLRFANEGSKGWAQPLSAEVGIGALADFSPDFDIPSNRYVSRQSVNFSTYIQVAYKLTDKVAILGSEWYVRDRNDDVNRMALGVSYSF